MHPWNKGRTKLNATGLQKISEARSKNNNFQSWYPKRKIFYAEIRRSAALAELYGTILGDGCIEKLARTEKLVTSFNSNEKDHIRHVAKMIERIIRKKPTTKKRSLYNCTDVYLYQKRLSERLEFPTGRKLNHALKIPEWIKNNKNYLTKCLKGLFETDGDWVIDKKYGTNVIKLTNMSQSLLKDVWQCLKQLGFSPKLQAKNTRLARSKEVYRFVKMIKFRQY